jgi:hypothetical protein
MNTTWGSKNITHAFLTLALDGGQWSASPSGYFTPRKEFEIDGTVGWVGPRAGVNVFEKRKSLSLCHSCVTHNIISYNSFSLVTGSLSHSLLHLAVHIL